MDHVIFVLYLLAFFSGVFISIVLRFLYFRYRNNILKTWSDLILNLTILEMVYMIMIYLQVFRGNVNIYPDIHFLFVTSIIDLCLIFTSQKFCFEITGKRIKPSAIFVSVLAGVVVIVSFPEIIPFNIKFSSDLRDISVAAYFIVLCLLIAADRKNIAEDVLAYCRKALVLFLIFLPCIVAGIFLKKLPVFKQIPQAAFSFSLTFLGLNIVSFCYIRRHLIRDLNSFSAILKNKYKLTKREIEIIQFVKQGLSNPQIAERLFISSRTVSNHLYAIFRKTGVKNRYELMKL